MLILMLVVLAAACSNGEQGVVAGDGPRDGGGGGTDPPAGAAGGGVGGLFVSIEMGGGFVPRGFDFRTSPSAVIYDDGTTLAPGAVIEIYPGPAVLPLTEGRIDDGQLRQLVAEAVTAGLLDDTQADFGSPPIADAPTTTVTVVVDGEVHVTSVYALGITDDGLPGPSASGGGLPGLDEPQRQARTRVSEFVDLVSSTVTGAETELYEPERYRLLALPSEQGLEPVGEPDVREWPFPDVALVEGECSAITGDRAVAFREMVDGITEVTRWRTDVGETFALSVRPVLPHEPDCPPGR